MRVAMEARQEAAERMRERVAAWLEALAPEQRARASFPFEDEAERTSWAYFPRDHKGLPFLAMEPRQQKLAHALIAGSLSLHAYGKATAIMALESVLNETEGRTRDAARDPGRYFVSVFGAPGDDPWGWRLEGHHVCLNFTIAQGALVSPTPIFFGANPAAVRHGDTPVVRPCGEEEDAARELLLSLDAEQRRVAVLCDTAPPDFVLSNAPRVPESSLPGDSAPPLLARLFGEMPAEHKEALRLDVVRPRGLAASVMSAAQRKLLSELIDVYVDRLPEPLARLERGKIDVESVHFAWAGEDRPQRGHYYRLQGPSFLVEYDNTQDGANHIHAVWRSPANDFGYDALRAHVGGAH
jgi:hypothetical protein